MTSPEPAPRVGLLGGTFDPPHLGHLIVAELARTDLGLDEVRFVVAGQPWMKRGTSSGDHRVAMTELATAGNGAFAVDRREVDRDGPTYTVETLEQLRDHEPGTLWTFLLGEDAAASVPQWHRGAEALALARFVVVTRPGSRVDLGRAPFDQMDGLDVPPIGISSTDLRARVRRGASIRYQVVPEVETYVRAHDLYRTQERDA